MGKLKKKNEKIYQMKIEPIEIPLLRDKYKLGWEWRNQQLKIMALLREKNATLISVTGGAIVWRVSFPRQKMWFKESDPIYITFSNCTKLTYFLGWPVWKTWKLFRKSFISRTQIARNWSEMNKCKALVSRICATPWIGNTRWIKRNHWWRFVLLPEI